MPLLARADGPPLPLTIYTDEWPPLSYVDNDEAKGMAVELVNLLQQRLQTSWPVQLMPWARAYSYLLTRSNVMLFVMGRNPERERLMTLVGPVATSTIMLYTRKGEAQRLRSRGAGLSELPLSGFRSSIFVAVARKHGFVNILESADSAQSVRQLMSHRVDLWSEGDSVVDSVLQKMGLPAGSVEPVMPLEQVDLYLAFSRGTPRSVVIAWEKALRAAKQDGSYAALYRRWLPSAPMPMTVERAGLEPVSD